MQNLFPKNSHHQFEFTIHSGVQESARCVANDYWPNRCTPVESSLFSRRSPGELCEAAYGHFDAAAPLTHRQQQYMRMYMAHLLSRIKRVTSECDNHSRFVWPREGTSSLLVEDHTLISQRCMRLLKGELKRRRCLKFILVCQLCLAAYELMEVTAPLSRRQQRSMRIFTINLRSCIKRMTRRDDSQSSDVWSREETRSLSSYAQQDEEYKASKGHTRIRRR